MAFIIKCERANKLRRTYFFTQKRRRGYAYDKDVKVYMINVEGDVNAIDVTSIGEDANDLVWFKLNDDDIVTDLYIKVVDTAEGVTTPVAGYSATVKASLAQVAVKGPDSTGDFDKVKTVAANALVASGYEVTKVEGTTISGLKFTVKNESIPEFV